MKSITVQQLIEAKGSELDLKVVAGERGLTQRRIVTPEMNRPGLAFAGFYDVFSHDRIQILGLTECSYLENLPSVEFETRVRRTFEFEIPCIVITTGKMPSPRFLELARERDIPVLATSHPTSSFSAKLSNYLEHTFAPTEVVHACMVDVFGLGVLLMGKSGIGKSECALELIERGHRLVADDSVVLRRLSRTVVVGTPARDLSHNMEVRGIGIIDVEKFFGIGAVAEEKRVMVVVQLERWLEGKTYERAGLETRFFKILDVQIPEYVLPVEPGRNLSLLVEMAALTQRLRNTGYNPAEEFNRRILERIRMRAAANRAGTPSLMTEPSSLSPSTAVLHSQMERGGISRPDSTGGEGYPN